MKSRLLTLSLLVCLVVLSAGTATAQGSLRDPYVILNKHIEATGGLEAINAVKSSYVEVKLVLVGTGLEGTVKTWSQRPNKSRQEVDLGFLKQSGGDNGEYPWGVDANGKVQIVRDEKSMIRRELQRYQSENEFLNPDSKIFKVTLEGTEQVGDKICYKVKIANTMNDDISYNFIDMESFLSLKTIAVTPEGESHTTFSDFRKAGQLIIPYKQRIESQPIVQVQEIEILKYESNPVIDPALFEPPTEDVKDFSFTNGVSAENIPFEFIDEHLYIEVMINGEKRLWCLDTGAGATVIDTRYAGELGLKLEGNIKGQGAGNEVDVSFTELPPFELTGIKFEKQKVAVIDIYSIFHKWGLDVHGILGYDFLSRFVIKIDYAKEQISFYDPAQFSYSGDGVVLEAPLSGNMFEVSAVVDGKYTGHWMVDIGAGGMSFHYDYAKNNGIHEKGGIDRMGMGAGGTFMTKMARFKTINFAGFEVKDPIISYPVEKGVGAFSQADLTGNLGNTLFRHFVLYFDYDKQRMIIERGDNFGKEFPEDHSGLQLNYSEDNKVSVMFAAPGSPAGKSGLKEGDIITAINGIEIENLGGLIKIKDMMEKPAGTKYELSVLRENKPMNVNLVLEKIL
jgi:predicted aspartyl protease